MGGTPNYPKGLGDQFNELKRSTREAFTSGNTREALDKIRAAALDLFGDLIVRPGGRLIAKYKNDQNALTVGAMTLSDGTPVHGVLIRRPGGETVLWTYGPDGGGSSFWALYDKTGNIVMSDDANSGQGLATPYIPYRAMPWSEVLSPPQSTTAATFTPLHRIHGQKQHPKIKTKLICQSDAATTGQVRLRDSVTGTVIAGPVDIPASDNLYRDLEGVLAGAHMADMFVDVEAVRTSGTGAIRLGIAYVEGKQS